MQLFRHVIAIGGSPSFAIFGGDSCPAVEVDLHFACGHMVADESCGTDLEMSGG